MNKCKWLHNDLKNYKPDVLAAFLQVALKIVYHITWLLAVPCIARKNRIVGASKTAAEGKIYLSFEVKKAMQLNKDLTSEYSLWTKREKEILNFSAEGFTGIQIAGKLWINIDTVYTHQKNLHNKLNVKNTAILLRVAIENNFLY